MKLEDLTGQRFGRLVVLSRAPDQISKCGRKNVTWHCLCDCGNEVNIRARNLKVGDTHSCGCLHKEVVSEIRFEDLTGRKFGKLTVIRQAEKKILSNGDFANQWICKCECGNKTIVTTTNLKRGYTKSCGCLIKDVLLKRNKEMKKYNTYDLESQEYGIGYTSKGDEFWFDKEDYDLIKDYCWYYDSWGHVATQIRRNEDEKFHIVFLHRIVMDAKENDVIDHINHLPRKEHKYDNRKSNLRIVTTSQNSMNQHIRSNNTSGIKGVCWDKNVNKWRAYIGYQNRAIRLGAFDNKEDAAKARKEAEEKYFGEYNLSNEKGA